MEKQEETTDEETSEEEENSEEEEEEELENIIDETETAPIQIQQVSPSLEQNIQPVENLETDLGTEPIRGTQTETNVNPYESNQAQLYEEQSRQGQSTNLSGNPSYESSSMQPEFIQPKVVESANTTLDSQLQSNRQGFINNQSTWGRQQENQSMQLPQERMLEARKYDSFKEDLNRRRRQ